MKTILITGASRGIGAATARLASEMGYCVGINYLKNQKLAEELAVELREMGGEVEIFQADISKEADVLRMFQEIDAKWGHLTALVNNTGILETQKKFVEMDLTRWKRIFDTNVMGSYLCCREAVKRMKLGGAIVNISSIAALTGAPFEYIDYASSKGAIESMTWGLAKELAELNIRVNGVRPAYIQTEIHADGGEPNRIERLKDSIPMKRGGHPQEVAEAIMWLVSEKSSYTSGTFIDVSGGR